MDTNEPTLALISDGTFFVDGEGHPGVITVKRFEDDHIEISVQPLTQLPYPMHLEVILDTNDMVHIRHLLKSQDLADVLQPAEHLESLDRMATSLHQHQVLDARRVEEIEKRLAELEKENLPSRVAYLERSLQ